jgi:hypothetical protein
MTLSSLLLSMMVRDFAFNVRVRQDMDQLLEVQQGVRSALSIITQELRQAGACLPRTGDLVSLTGNDSPALEGEDAGQRDTLMIRVGKVTRDNLVCIRTVTTTAAAAGSSQLVVQDASEFAADDWVYIRGNSGAGRSYRVGSVGGSTITLTGPLGEDYGTGSGVFASEERVYSVDTSGGDRMLTVSIDGGDPQPLVDGVEQFNVKYKVAPCPPCSSVNEPADADEWLLVRELDIKVRVRSRRKNRSGEWIRLVGNTNVKPRNLLR